jgi:hypothetical protein
MFFLKKKMYKKFRCAKGKDHLSRNVLGIMEKTEMWLWIKEKINKNKLIPLDEKTKKHH